MLRFTKGGGLGRPQPGVSPPGLGLSRGGPAVSWGWERRSDWRRFCWSGRFAQRPSPALWALRSPARGGRPLWTRFAGTALQQRPEEALYPLSCLTEGGGESRKEGCLSAAAHSPKNTCGHVMTQTKGHYNACSFLRIKIYYHQHPALFCEYFSKYFSNYTLLSAPLAAFFCHI